MTVCGGAGEGAAGEGRSGGAELEQEQEQERRSWESGRLREKARPEEMPSLGAE